VKKQPTKYVITAEPERANSKYWDSAGHKNILPLAAEFYSFFEAKQFADENGIEINGTLNSIVVKS
jgi:hypothetical protein